MFGSTPPTRRAAPPTGRPSAAPNKTARTMSAAQYEKHKARVAARQKANSLTARDIGPIPPVLHPRRRDRCRLDLTAFCETYLAGHFPLTWSKSHRRILRILQRAVLDGGRCCYAMPRGFGKTTIAAAAALWAVLYGHHAYVVIVSATGRDASKLLKGIKTTIETTPELAEDFPEVTFPVQALAGITQRGPGQMCQGRPTRLHWKADQIILPDIPAAPSAGAILETVGITGAIRGRRTVQTDGRIRRPSLVLIDDPQTRASARSPEATRARLDIIAGDILGLNSPLAVVCTVTVIQPGDLAAQLLDPKKSQAWQPQRSGILDKLPTNLDAWHAYGEILHAELAAGRRNHPQATAYYRANRAAMDAGTVATWPDKYTRRRELSAIQHAMNLYLDNPAAFAAEYMNDPVEEQAAGLTLATVETIATRTHDFPRGTAPAAADKLTAFIDCHGRLLYWAVCAWQRDLTGYVIDYGTWPEQTRKRFSLATAPNTIARAYPGRTEEAALRSALDDLAGLLLARRFPSADGPRLIDLAFTDTGWNSDVVYQACAASPHAPRLQPSKGAPIGPGRRPMTEWRRNPGDKIGPGYLFTRPAKRHARALFIDANHWKTNLHRALARPPHEPGGLALFHPPSPAAHELIAEHLTAEAPTETFGLGRTVYVWQPNPGRPDNHWLDCLTGCMVAAAFLGCAGSAAGPAATNEEQKPAADEAPAVTYLKI